MSLGPGRLLRRCLRLMVVLLVISVGALAMAIVIGLRGYRALTYEEVAAEIEVRPVGPQRFTATVRIPDRPDTTFLLAGDEVYVDAHVLKWKPWANLLGLHTAYELDRVAGRYTDVDQERTGERTIHSLAPDRTVDLFALRRRHAFLGRVLDAEYGSGTFVPVRRPATFEIRVSTTGLLVREATVPGA